MPGDAGSDGGVVAPLDILSIDTDVDSTCVVRLDHSVWCWGGPFGTSPMMVPGAGGAVDVGVGEDHYCFATTSGGAACWGDNSARQTGRNTSGTPVASATSVPLLTDVATVAAGYRHSCARKTDGSAMCWGDQVWGQLGNGSMSTFNDSAADDVDGITNAVQLEVGPYHSCARLDTGVVACWGRDMGPAGGDVAEPTAVSGVSDAAHISVALGNGCAARTDGTVVCWGTSFSVLSPVAGVTDAVQVANGRAHGCAILSSGEVACWGRNFAGQLGNGTLSDSTAAVMVTDLTDAVAITAYADHNCAVRATGDVVCWGGNDAGQLGDGTTIDQSAPVPVTLP